MNTLYPRSFTGRSRRGSALIVALILCIAVGTVIAYVLRSSVTEARLNEYHFLSLNSRNAAESLVDYGVGQLIRRWDNQISFRDDQLAPSKTPLTIEDEMKIFLESGHIATSSLALVGGTIPPNAQFYINPDDPANRFDPHKGKIVLARNIEVYGRATATHPIIGEHTAYAMQTLQLRDAPLFSHAIFYNMDLEFHPGPTMTINGPVHANGNIWAVAKADLFFTNTVTTSLDFRVSMMRSAFQGDWSGMSGENTQSGTFVKIKNADGTYLNPYRGSGSTNKEASYYTSISATFTADHDNWREFSSNRWSGNLQTRDHGIPILNPIGYSDYVPDYDGSTTIENHAYAIIEPNLPLASPYHKAEGEEEKFARKAGLVMRVHRDLVINATGAPGEDGIDDERGTVIPTQAVRLRQRPDADDSWTSSSMDWYDYHRAYRKLYDTWVATGDLDGDGSPDPQPVYEPVDVSPLLASKTHEEITYSEIRSASLAAISNPDAYNTGYYLSFAYLNRVDNTEPNSDLIVNTSTITRTNADGETETVTVSEVNEIGVNMHASFAFTTESDYDPANPAEFGDYVASQAAFGAQLRGEFDEMFAAHPVLYEKDDNVDYNGDGDKNDLPSGMIDKRIESAGGSTNVAKSRINLVELNLTAFSRQVETWRGDTFQNYYMPHRYNGVVYVEFPPDPSHTPRASDKIVKSAENLGLLLTQGGGADPYAGTGKVPDPAYNIDKADRDRGFTLATNNTLYVRGHFNADGNLATPSGVAFTESDSVAAPDPPVALAADAITILSPNWSLANSVNTNPVAHHTEFCAAIVCGLMPTNKGGATVSSGGSHNFPRFLENWGGKTFRYRGSLVALFESEIQNQRWSTGYYSPPARQWGFFSEFARGNYPPGTPNVRSFRKVDFRFLTPAEFAKRIDDLPWSITLP
jgi:hypothetical protein